MASRLKISETHYKRIEKKGYPWSYRKTKKFIKMFPTILELNEDNTLHRLHEWLINKKMHYLITRGHYNRPEILESQPPFTSEKLVIKILERFGLKINKDFMIHKTVNGKNIDLILKPDIFIEILKIRKNTEVAYFMAEKALEKLRCATKNKLKRVIIVLPASKGKIGCEILDLLKGGALVFFSSSPIPQQNIRLLNYLNKKKTISELHSELHEPRETIRSRLKSLMSNNFVKRTDKFTWLISKRGLKLIKLCEMFLVTNGNFLKPNLQMLQRNEEFIKKIIKLRENSVVKAKIKDEFSSNIANVLRKGGIKISKNPLQTKFNPKFPDIVATFKKRKFVIECVRAKKSTLYYQVLRLVYKFKILKKYSNDSFLSVAIISCKDEPLQFIPPNNPFKILSETCDKIFIDSNLNELTSFIKGC